MLVKMLVNLVSYLNFSLVNIEFHPSIRELQQILLAIQFDLLFSYEYLIKQPYSKCGVDPILQLLDSARSKYCFILKFKYFFLILISAML